MRIARRRPRAARRRSGAAPPAAPSCGNGPPGTSEVGSRSSRFALPRLSVIVPVALSIADTVQPVPSSRGSSPPSPSSNWCCCGREAERPLERPRARVLERQVDRLLAVVLEAAERLAVVGELLVGHRAGGGSTTTSPGAPRAGGTRAAGRRARGRRPRPPWRAARREAATVSSGASSVSTCGLALGRRQERDRDAVLALRLGPPVEQPVAQLERREAVLLVVGGDRRRAAPGRGRRASARTRSPPRCPSRRRPAA